ncbi:MAG: serine/threonine-protein kinase, partial [Mariniblastus sp.]
MASKKPKTRYALQDQIGSGDFAKVYAAEDTKLGRKVAIKQLHSQFLDDQEKLERYWRESRLMLDLDHPNIMTIYDVIKSRGCLVLELMRGSLKEVFADKPMPVDDVRETIIEAAKGLECMHKNGIVHGDVKPANLMLSRQDVVKLGDFGLARRVSDDDGSLLKGTTKYMAPELVSEDFGEVGPASDLYSLGFSALELMIGPDFDSLFPDLIAFGRDKQMAWMMWHCSADRKFPAIQSMLDGVPDDLATAIEKLTAKNQADRYKTAREVISDLSGGVKPVGESLREAELAKLEREKQLKKKKRTRAIMVCVASLLVCGAILFLTREKKAPPVAVAPAPDRGVIQSVLPVYGKFVIDIGGDWKEITLRNADEVTLNRKKRQLRDLQTGDRVVVSTIIDDDGRRHREVVGFRPETHSGVISKITFEPGDEENTGTATLAVKITEGDETGNEFELKVSNETSFTVNEVAVSSSGATGASELQHDDRVVVNISDDESGMLALKVDALRLIKIEGFVRKLDPRRGQITIASNFEEDAKLVTLPI